MQEVRNRFKPTDLPFVGNTKARQRTSFWTVPPKGDFAKGSMTGTKMAAAFLRYLATKDTLPPILPQIVLDMAQRTDISDALHGQIVGFFSTLEQAMHSKDLQAKSEGESNQSISLTTES